MYLTVVLTMIDPLLPVLRRAKASTTSVQAKCPSRGRSCKPITIAGESCGRLGKSIIE